LALTEIPLAIREIDHEGCAEMTSIANPRDLIGAEVVDRDGERVGKVGNVYVGDDNRQPQWVTVRTGLFGQKESFVPLRGAKISHDGLRVQTTKDAVKDAPRMDADGHLSDEEGRRLYQHYGLPGQRGRTTPNAGIAGSGGQRNAGDQAMTRSEEQLHVGTEQTESGRVRLHKYVVTEEQQVTVPVRHEEVRVEREPARGGERARIGEDDQEVVLHAERPVVQTEAVPVEKVRLRTETVTEQRTVSGKVRKERIEVDDSTEHKK
jgi:uncharacterized protein (TIGR02271 family)